MFEESTEPEASAEDAPVTPITLPDDHPLVKTLAAQKDEIRSLKEKATRLDEIEEASKSEAQKQAERLAAAEKAAADAEARVTRRELALEYKLTSEDAALLDNVSDEDALKALAERLAKAAEPSGPRTPRPDPNQGRSGDSPASTGDLFAAVVQDLIH